VNGSEQWAKKIDGTIYSVQGTSDGGYIGAGIIPEVPGSKHPDGWLIKVDSNGDEHWNNTFRGMGFLHDRICFADRRLRICTCRLIGQLG